MDVTDVLRDRMREPDGLQRMAAISAFAHAALVALVILAPGGWIARRQEPPKVVMTITLNGGTPGPSVGGLTSMGGRAVQTVAAPEAKPTPSTAPAEKQQMTVPIPGKTPTKATPSQSVKQAPDTARGKTASTGKEITAGSTSADTLVRGQGFGLSTTSRAAGSGITLDNVDIANFCCLDYLQLMKQRIQQNWTDTADAAGSVIVKFTIQRNGTFTDVVVEKQSNVMAQNINAQRAVLLTRQILPLPDQYPNNTLGVHLTFEYKR